MTPMGATQAGAEFATEKQMSIDDKLREKLDTFARGVDETWLDDGSIEDAKNDIKQAFADENVPYGTGEFSFAEKAANEGYMTGQAWYSAFQEELFKPYQAVGYKSLEEVSDKLYLKNALRAAKKAAGLK